MLKNNQIVALLMIFSCTFNSAMQDTDGVAEFSRFIIPLKDALGGTKDPHEATQFFKVAHANGINGSLAVLRAHRDRCTLYQEDNKGSIKVTRYQNGLFDIRSANLMKNHRNNRLISQTETKEAKMQTYDQAIKGLAGKIVVASEQSGHKEIGSIDEPVSAVAQSAYSYQNNIRLDHRLQKRLDKIHKKTLETLSENSNAQTSSSTQPTITVSECLAKQEVMEYLKKMYSYQDLEFNLEEINKTASIEMHPAMPGDPSSWVLQIGKEVRVDCIRGGLNFGYSTQSDKVVYNNK